MKIQSLRELRDEMRAVAQGRQPAPEDAASPSFESAEALLRLLNPENRALLALIDSERPQSLTELAKLSGRAESNLSRTLGKLEAMGVIRLVQGQGRSKVAELLVRKLVVEIDVCQPPGSDRRGTVRRCGLEGRGLVYEAENPAS